MLIVDPGAQETKLRSGLRGRLAKYHRHEFLLRPAVRLVVYVAES